MSNLDLYSTSQTDLGFEFSIPAYTRGGCVYHAPFFAIEKNASSGVWTLSQGSCNHWDCPRCGVIRAKEEYWRIVKGSEQVMQQNGSLYFITITTRGAGLKVAAAEANYLQWTNRLLTNLRKQHKSHDGYWCYVQVTERQKRRHPHSHILTTYKPMDLVEGAKLQYEQVNGRKQPYWQDAMRSENLQAAVCSSGLGEQYDISQVRNVSAVARYVGKYLFKSSLLTVWPKGWRRVRYSNNWPKFPLAKTNAIALLTHDDWRRLAGLAEMVVCHESEAHSIASSVLCPYSVEVKLKQ